MIDRTPGFLESLVSMGKSSWTPFAALMITLVSLVAPLASAQQAIGDINLQRPAPAAWKVDDYLSLIKGKRVGLVVNHTSMVGNRHLADTLSDLGIQIAALFGPEHGYRGSAPDGEQIGDQRDPLSGVPVISLYGKKKKPSSEDLSNLDIVVFDIQDVGTRFYTYISTMHFVMEACAEAEIPVVILDRPNPNGHYVDGPVLDTSFSSFVGMHPIPVVHGLTVGELALMINGEKWLGGGLSCELTVIPCAGYTHSTVYELPVRPSPNLPNMRSIYLYPTLCFFEGTTFSVGRGTEFPFQQLGHPELLFGNHEFTPAPNAGSFSPKHKGVKCRGISFQQAELETLRRKGRLDLSLFIEMYQSLPEGTDFFRSDGYFDLLAGTDALRKQIESGAEAETIRQSWEKDLLRYRNLRTQYLLYPE